MAEFEWPGRPERASLRRALRHRLRLDMPSLRVIAEDFLSGATLIDLLAVGVCGELVSLRLGVGEEDEDRKLLTSVLADLHWLRNHGPDLRRLAPGLGIELAAEPRAMLFCPTICIETRSAIDLLPTGTVELNRYRCLRQQGQLSLLIEPCDPIRDERSHPTPRSPIEGPSRSLEGYADPSISRGQPRPELTAPPSPSSFRTGLTDAELQLAPLGHDVSREDPRVA